MFVISTKDSLMIGFRVDCFGLKAKDEIGDVLSGERSWKSFICLLEVLIGETSFIPDDASLNIDTLVELFRNDWKGDGNDARFSGLRIVTFAVDAEVAE
jgi:hypothetical protein